MIIKVKKTSDDVKLPSHGSEYAAGWDLYAHTEAETQYIRAGQTVKVGTGICMEIPAGYFGAVYARSGLATNHGLRPANCVGVVDSDYRGEIMVALHNDSASCKSIHNGDRIAQIVITPYLPVSFVETDELSDTVRGAGGFGSTGIADEQGYEQLSLFESEKE